MAVPSIRASITYNYAVNKNDNDVAIAVPTGTSSGNLLIAVIAAIAGSTVSSYPAGWENIVSATNGSYASLAIYKKTAGTESGTYTFAVTDTGDPYPHGVVLCITGQDSTCIDENTGNTGSGTAAAENNITVTRNESLTLWCVSSPGGASSSHATLTEKYDTAGTGGTHIGIYAGSADAGTATGPTITLGTSTNWTTLGIAIGPSLITFKPSWAVNINNHIGLRIND